jgi:hypothetical protein
VWWRLLASALAPAFTSASTLLGVARLGFEGQLVEVDLTAELPAAPPGASSQGAASQQARDQAGGPVLQRADPQPVDRSPDGGR